MLIKEIQRIVCAACLYDNGVIIVSARHYDTLMCNQLAIMNPSQRANEVQQGFIDQWGNFLDRKEALEVARRQGQIYRELNYNTEELYSEMLY